MLRGHWCDIFALNVHSSAENKTNYIKDNFYEKLERVLDQCSKYHLKKFLGDFSAKAGREVIFKQRIDMDLHHLIKKVNRLIIHTCTNSRYMPSIV